MAEHYMSYSAVPHSHLLHPKTNHNYVYKRDKPC